MAKRTKRGKKINQSTLIFGGIVLIIVIALIWITPSAVSPEEISVAEAYQMREDGAFILDVREPDEWEAGHIPGAVLIPKGQLAARISEVPEGVDIVVVCRSGNRSYEAAVILLEAGYDQAVSMAGGVIEWIDAGYETVTGP